MRDKIEIPAELFVQMFRALPAWEEASTEMQQILTQCYPLAEIAHRPRWHFVGKRWFRKSAGHTVTKLYLYENGELVHTSTETGYGDYYLQMGVAWLKANRAQHLPDDVRGDTLCVREVLHGDYDVHDVERERDL